MNSAKGDEGLKVFIRVRPPISKEVKHSNAVTVAGTKEISVHSEKHNVNCNYDHIFDELCEQQDVFDRVQPLLSDVLNGFNACIFAYGQTSAGKSFTM